MSIELQPSRWLLISLALIHGLAIVAAWWSALPLLWLMVVELLVLFSAWRNLRRYGRDLPQQLHWRGQQWWLTSGTEEVAIHWSGKGMITPWLMVLPYRREAGRPGALVLPVDSAEAESLRALRVQLRFNPQ